MEGRNDETARLLACPSEAGRRKLLADAFTRHRKRLRFMVYLRLHPLLRGRVDPSDVLQEAFLAAARKLPRYVRDAPMPFFIWLRRVTAEKLHEIHRNHFAAQVRDARLELRLPQLPAGPEASSITLVDLLDNEGLTPSETAMNVEERASVQKALDGLDPMDREILVLRYFEKLSSAEAAEVLGLKIDAARKRYLRALRRLRKVFGKTQPPGDDGP